MERVAAPCEGLDKLAGLLPGPEDDLNLPADGVETENLRGLHEFLSDIGDDDVPTVTSQHVLIGLLADLTCLLSSQPAPLTGYLGSGTHCDESGRMADVPDAHFAVDFLGFGRAQNGFEFTSLEIVSLHVDRQTADLAKVALDRMLEI